MAPRLPIRKRWVSRDVNGRACIFEVDIVQSDDKFLYPPNGIKSVFKVLRERVPGEEDFEVVILIDNHDPFGFHEHPKLPDENNYRVTIHVSTWQEAWIEFEKRSKEILNET